MKVRNGFAIHPCVTDRSERLCRFETLVAADEFRHKQNSGVWNKRDKIDPVFWTLGVFDRDGAIVTVAERNTRKACAALLDLIVDAVSNA